MTPRQSLWEFFRTRQPLTVGAIADSTALTEAEFDCEIVELRLDSLGTGNDLISFVESCPCPLLLTARGKIEGGQSEWSIEERAAAYRKLMPFASAIDIELRDFEVMGDIVSEAREQGIVVVGSFHDFQATPPLEILLSKKDDRADILKFALMAHSTACIQSQLAVFEAFQGRALSVMGMGPLGAAARPLMAKAGSILNYGYLGNTPTAPNQWPAGLLKQALSV